MSSVWQDLRFAVRTLGNSPGFTLIALTALALGIGANTAIFTVVDSVLLRPLPYPDSGRIAILMRHYPGGNSEALSQTKFRFYEEHKGSFSDVAAQDVLGVGLNLSGAGEPERVPSIRVSEAFFRVLNVKPAMGRTFLPEEDRPGGPNVVVLSHSLWQRRFGSDPAVLARALTLGGQSYTVVGVMPPRFKTFPEAEIWSPVRAVASAADRANMLLVLGRLKSGVTFEQADANHKRNLGAFFREYPSLKTNDQESATVAGYQQYLTGDLRTPMLILLSAVGLVLLIACANVANLMLARATGRTKEMAIRTALGARRGQILRQLLTESLMLSLAGAALGLLLARAAINSLVALAGSHLPPLAEIRMDPRVLAFTVCAAILTGLLFGLAPALQAARGDVNSTLREGTGRATAGQHRGLLRNVLVVVEVSLAVVLLVGAALLLRSFGNLRVVSPGFNAENVLSFQMSLGSARTAQTSAMASFLRKAEERIETVPGVQAAATVTNLPMELGPDLPYEVMGASGQVDEAQWRHISHRYFEVMQIPMKRGRALTEADNETSEPVVIINEALARSRFKDKDPLGESILIGRVMGPDFADKPRRIVGTVADIRERGLDREAPPTAYVPAAQVPNGITRSIFTLLPATWVVRTVGTPMQYGPAIRQSVLQVDPEQALANLRPLSDVLCNSASQRRFNAVLLALFAGLALLLAAVGVYGVLSYAISQRTNEIGLRVALGASRADVLRLVLGKGLSPALLGLVFGLAASFGLSRFLESQLFGLSARDPLTFALVGAVLLTV